MPYSPITTRSPAASTDSLKPDIGMTGTNLGPNFIHGDVRRATIYAALDGSAQPRQLLVGRKPIPAPQLVGSHHSLGLHVVDGLGVHDLKISQKLKRAKHGIDDFVTKAV